MLKELVLEQWKSFKTATLYFDPLSVLIGTNSSGKSNALDALTFLQAITKGKTIEAALHEMRGGVAWATLFGYDAFTLTMLIDGEQESKDIDYLYSITVETNPEIVLRNESLKRITYRHKTTKNPDEIFLFKTDYASSHEPSIVARIYNGSKGTPRDLKRSNSILYQLLGILLHKKVEEAMEKASQVLTNIFVFDPIPSKMRDFAALSSVLASDGSNIAGVLADLKEAQKKELEDNLTLYMENLPEQDIRRIWAEPVGRFKQDAMLYCEESWGLKPPITVDARAMSDGTLRFLAILIALLTRPKFSQLVIEEVDNALHPSRIDLLLRALKELGEKMNIDILITTHNPALLDALGPEMISRVTVAHRDIETGLSKLTLLEDVDNLPKLMSQGKLGKVITQGMLEKSLANNGSF